MDKEHARGLPTTSALDPDAIVRSAGFSSTSGYHGTFDSKAELPLNAKLFLAAEPSPKTPSASDEEIFQCALDCGMKEEYYMTNPPRFCGIWTDRESLLAFARKLLMEHQQHR